MNKRTINIFLFCFFFLVCVLHYGVLFLYWFGEKFGGFPTYLSVDEMLSYLTTALGAGASAFIGIVAIWQTKKIDDISKSPSIFISEIANDPFNIISEHYKFVPKEPVENSNNAVVKKNRFYFKINILDKDLEKIAVSDFYIYEVKNDSKKKEIIRFSDTYLPGEYCGNFSFLRANSECYFFYSTDVLKIQTQYLAEFTTKCKTLDGNWYKKKWNMRFVYPQCDDEFSYFISHSIQGTYWTKCSNVNDYYK